MAKKLGFALGSGGSRGVAHIGFLKAMEENGIKPDFIAGTSMGSVVGSCFAAGMNSDDLMAEVKKFKPSEIFDLSLNPLGNGAIMRTNKMKKKLEKYLGTLTFDELKIPFSAIATDLVSGHTYAFDGDKKVLDYVVASSSIPCIFSPTYIEGMALVDGGVGCRVPVNEVRKMGAEAVVAVDVLGEVRQMDRRYNMVGVVFRTFEIMDCHLTERKLKKNKPDLILSPDLGDMSQYKFKDLDMAYEKGYEIGKEYAPKIIELVNAD